MILNDNLIRLYAHVKNKIRVWGNTSLSGASMALLSTGARAEIDEIRNRITYVELNVNQEFMGLFSAARFIPHTDRSLFPSVQVWGTR